MRKIMGRDKRDWLLAGTIGIYLAAIFGGVLAYFDHISWPLAAIAAACLTWIAEWLRKERRRIAPDILVPEAAG